MSQAIKESLQALHSLQQTDSQIQKLQKQQAGINYARDETAAAEAAHGHAEEVRREFNHVSADLKDNELKLATIETKRKQYEQKLYQGKITNTRELQNMEREIEALSRQRADLDGRILELMETVESVQTKLAEADATSREAEQKRLAQMATDRTKFERIQAELNDLTCNRPELLSCVPDPTLLRKYDEIRKKAGGLAIAKVDENACGGCHMALPSMTLKNARDAEEYVQCDNCGRLLLP